KRGKRRKKRGTTNGRRQRGGGAKTVRLALLASRIWSKCLKRDHWELIFSKRNNGRIRGGQAGGFVFGGRFFLPWQGLWSPGRRRRGGCVQHGDGRLSRVYDRSVLCGRDSLLHVPAHRELWRAERLERRRVPAPESVRVRIDKGRRNHRSGGLREAEPLGLE